jgi:hypothetical protein
MPANTTSIRAGQVPPGGAAAVTVRELIARAPTGATGKQFPNGAPPQPSYSPAGVSADAGPRTPATGLFLLAPHFLILDN